VANVRSSNSKLLAVGFAVLVVGVLLVLVIIRNTDDPPAQPSPVATEQDPEPVEPTPLTAEQLSTARLPLPLEVPDGTEAMAVRINFVRSVAAIPAPGDRVNVYRFLSAEAAQAAGDGATEAPVTPSTPTTTLPDPGPDSEQVIGDVEVLAVTGPLPASNDGVLTMVLAVPSADVPGLMPLADDSQLWFTLLPAAEEEPTDAPTDASTDEGTESSEEPA
jgi:Flp pilus assembly protein CpaB